MRLFSFLFAMALLAGCQRQSAPEAVQPSAATSDPARLEKISEFYLEGQTNRALQEFETYVKQYPRDGLAWTILGRIHSDLRVFEEASAAYEKALAINPRDPIALTGMGVLHRRFDHDELALEYYQKSLAVEDSYAETHTSIMLIYLKRRQDALALKHALRGYELDQTNPDIAANLAVAYHYNNDTLNRDKLTQIAIELGYQGRARLEQIYSGEFTLRDDE